MLANKDPFINKYNMLEELCGQKYPQPQGGKPKNAIIYFAESSGIVSKKDQKLLKAIVAVRNTIHDTRNLFNVNTACLQFMDGVIAALKTGTTEQIDAELENVKKSNVNRMLETMKYLQAKIHIISAEEQKKVKAKLTGYIESEKRASSEERAKSFYAEFYSYFNNLHNLPEIRKAKAQRREKSLEKKREEVLSVAHDCYLQALAKIRVDFLGVKKKELKHKFLGLKERILACNDFDDLDDLIDEAEERFDID